jgi:hypothetical protein
MSYAELDSIHGQGIDAIINLCAEFCDLHEIESSRGFEVYYLPVCDNQAPAMTELDVALDWLDEAIHLGKKVLVHCRQGIGRTGTFVTAYLLRKGFGLKLARKRIEKTRAGFTSFPQWRLLRKYTRNSGELSIREPSLEIHRTVDFQPFFRDYELLLAQVDDAFHGLAAADETLPRCGRETDQCCFRLLDLHIIEAAYLSHKMNKSLRREERKRVIERAVAVSYRTRQLERQVAEEHGRDHSRRDQVRLLYARERIRCPLNVEGQCCLYAARPVSCRLYDLPQSPAGDGESFGEEGRTTRASEPPVTPDHVNAVLQRLSKNVYHALTSAFLDVNEPTFTLASTVSGRFVQEYFEYAARAELEGKPHKASGHVPDPPSPS